MILITGAARSGTSITANMIKVCGAHMGGINSNGENRNIRDNITKPYLEKQGYDPLCQDILPDPRKMKPFPEMKELVLNELGNVEPMAYKGAKMCHYWTIWAEAFPDAKWVIVRRDSDRIVDSCIRTVFMSKRHNHEQWHDWVNEHLKRFEEMKKALDCIEVWPVKAVNGDYSDYKKMIKFVGLKWNDEAENVITTGKFHQ